jgi:hypothetical protein
MLNRMEEVVGAIPTNVRQGKRLWGALSKEGVLRRQEEQFEDVETRSDASDTGGNSEHRLNTIKSGENGTVKNCLYFYRQNEADKSADVICLQFTGCFPS